MNSYYIWIHIFCWYEFVCLFILQVLTGIKKELFVMAVRTPCGKTFPGNFSIIPSAKKWVVFHAIYCLAFLLCGDEVCSMNYLVLTDKEDAEYRLFESLIATNDKYKYSKVMLCIFLALGLIPGCSDAVKTISKLTEWVYLFHLFLNLILHNCFYTNSVDFSLIFLLF